MGLVLENYGKIMQDGFGSTYLEHQIHLMSHPENQTAGAVDQQYCFSSTAQRLAYCFNYTRNHWTVVATDIYEGIGKHSVYNSMQYDPENTIFSAAKKQLPDLEKLIQTASQLPTSTESSHITAGQAFEPDISNDCDIVAVHNAICLLNGEKPALNLGTKQARIQFVAQIYSKLTSILSSQSNGNGLLSGRTRSEPPEPEEPKAARTSASSKQDSEDSEHAPAESCLPEKLRPSERLASSVKNAQDKHLTKQVSRNRQLIADQHQVGNLSGSKRTGTFHGPLSTPVLNRFAYCSD